MSLPTASRGDASTGTRADADASWSRLAAVKEHLALLQTQRAAGQELSRAFDGKFLDLLVASENAARPALRLSLQSIDLKNVREPGPAALRAVSGLAGELVKGMHAKHDQWHAVLHIDDHYVTVAARHDARHPERVSLAVIDSTKSDVKDAEWHQIAQALCAHANHALVRAGKPPEARVWLNCLNTSILQTASGSGSDVFALAAVRKMQADGGLITLHRRVLDQQGRTASPTAARTIDGNGVLGARFLKLMTYPQTMDALLRTRPELQQAQVNRKGQTLADYQAAHSAQRKPPFGMPYRQNAAYEEKRLRLFERAVAHLGTKLAPRLDEMKARLHDLRLAAESGADLPSAPDARFLGMLIDAENARDPSSRLSTHRLDRADLAAGNPAATDGIWRSIVQGMRSGKDWQATLDIEGHHVAASARHDADRPGHLSLVVMDSEGSPMSSEDWKRMVAQLVDRTRKQPAVAGAGESVKIWMTHLAVSADQSKINGAELALIAAREMAVDPDIAEVHADTLALAKSRPEPAALRSRPGDHLLHPDGQAHADDPMATSDELIALQVEMYEQAVSHHEQALGLQSASASH